MGQHTSLHYNDIIRSYVCILENDQITIFGGLLVLASILVVGTLNITKV